VLGILPAGEMGRERTLQWAQAAAVFTRLRSQRMYWQYHQPFNPITRDFLTQEASFKDDPFLESVFWEEGALLFNIQRNLPFALACYQKALEKGYPTAQIYNEMGTLEALKGSRAQARLDFEKALAAPLNRTTAESNLQVLGMKEGK
jgi:tetratricopeptide (TPR) repeat protein